MRSIPIISLAIIIALFAWGCYRAHTITNEDDSGFDKVNNAPATAGWGGAHRTSADSGGIDAGYSDLGGRSVRPLDAGILEATVTPEGTDGVDAFLGRTERRDTSIDDSGVAPCYPNCPVLDWIEIPGGIFKMGGLDSAVPQTELPVHEVTVQGFHMLRTEVTVSQFAGCIEAGGCDEAPPSLDTNWGEPDRENYPMNGVSWYQARQFSEWVGGRLPSEAEWEYAARNGERNTIYPWGDDEATCEYAQINYGAAGNSCGNHTTLAVCSKPLGNTNQGLCDMVGNVWEWVEDDWYNNYDAAPSDGRARVNNPVRADFRVIRGGCWYFGLDKCRVAWRSAAPPDFRIPIFGFRVVMDMGG